MFRTRANERVLVPSVLKSSSSSAPGINERDDDDGAGAAGFDAAIVDVVVGGDVADERGATADAAGCRFDWLSNSFVTSLVNYTIRSITRISRRAEQRRRVLYYLFCLHTVLA